MKLKFVLILFGFLFFSCLNLLAGNENKTNQNINILVVGFANNIQSDFIPKFTLAEKLHVGEHEFDALLHQKLIAGFSNLSIGTHQYIVLNNLNDVNQIRKLFQFHGENGELNFEFSPAQATELQEIMKEYQADFLLVFTQYDFKWQEIPVNTLFHILSYSVLDRNLVEIRKGQEHFNTFTNFKPRDLERQLTKVIRRKAIQLERSLQQAKMSNLRVAE